MAALPDALLDEALDRTPVARLALTAADRRPEALPIVFARVGRTLFSPIDGKPKASARPARLAHLERQPEVSLVLDHYEDDWDALWWIRLDARASVAEGAHANWDAAVAALRAKYPQYGTTPLFRGEPVLVCLAIARVRWWAPRGEDGVRAWLARQPSA